MKSITTLVFTLIISFVTFGQEATFSAVAVNGTCMIQRGSNPDEFVPITSGVEFYSNDKIIITGEDSYICLATAKGKVTELTKAGVFSVDEVSLDLVKGNASLAQEYVKLLEINMALASENATKYNTYAAAVKRSSGNSNIMMFLPSRTKVAKEPSSIEWVSNSSSTDYKVEILNLYEEKVYSEVTTNKEIEIDFSNIQLQPGQMYRIAVSEAENKNNVSGEIALQVPTRSELAQFETELEMLKNEVPVNSAIADMVFATYFEEKGLYLQAIPYYQRAIEKEPNIVEYQNAYNVFLYKIGLDSFLGNN